jgi:hypothetical protein
MRATAGVSLISVMPTARRNFPSAERIERDQKRCTEKP